MCVDQHLSARDVAELLVGSAGAQAAQAWLGLRPDPAASPSPTDGDAAAKRFDEGEKLFELIRGGPPPKDDPGVLSLSVLLNAINEPSEELVKGLGEVGLVVAP